MSNTETRRLLTPREAADELHDELHAEELTRSALSAREMALLRQGNDPEGESVNDEQQAVEAAQRLSKAAAGHLLELLRGETHRFVRSRRFTALCLSLAEELLAAEQLSARRTREILRAADEGIRANVQAQRETKATA